MDLAAVLLGDLALADALLGEMAADKREREGQEISSPLGGGNSYSRTVASSEEGSSGAGAIEEDEDGDLVCV